MRDVEVEASAMPDLPWMEADVLDAGEPSTGAGEVDPRSFEIGPAAGAPATASLFGHEFCVGAAAGVVAAVAGRPASRPRMIVTANVDHIVRLAENADFSRAYARAAARTLDGMPLVWLARARHGPPVARLTGHDLLACVLADPQAFAARVFLVCPRQAVADAVGERLRGAGLPGEAIASAVPPFGFEDDPAYSRTLAARIRAHGTSLLVMGVGAPKSEIWVDRQDAAIGNPVVLCVGDALAVAGGCMPRAPKLMQRLGTEWLFRFLLEPRRLFRRYFLNAWRFLPIAAREYAKRRPGERHP